MFTRKLGRSNIEISALGMGCWAIGGPFFEQGTGTPLGWGEVDDEESIRVIHHALDLGIKSMTPRRLAERGVEAESGELPVPESVQGIIAARLDTLPLDEKALAQDAAVLGKVFWVGELAHVAGLDLATVDERLRVLDRKEFVRRERRSSVAGETAYVFRHVLVRDVAYGQIPRARRIEKHRLAAEWIERLGGDRREDLADVVAHHHLSALELARAMGKETPELVERARLALREAGDRAAALSALEAAGRFYGEALALWPEDDPERPNLLLRHGKVLVPRGGGEDVLAAAAEELLDAGHREEAAEAESLLGGALWIQGRHQEAFGHLAGAVELLADEPPSRAKAFVLAALARFHMMGDEAGEAVRFGSEAQAMADELGLDELKASALNTLGVCRVLTGDLGGLADLEHAIEISRQRPSFELVRALNNLGSTLIALGELERAYRLYAEAAAVAKRIGWTGALLWVEAEQAGLLQRKKRGSMRRQFEDAVVERVMGHVRGRVLGEAEIEAMVDRLVRREVDPFTAADAVVRRLSL